MSYCRWSCMDYQSDIYCYEHVYGGIMIHVAARKLDGEIPKKPPFTKENIDNGTWIEAHRAQIKALESVSRKPIGLPYDGKTIHVETHQEALDILMELREVGYQVPNHAIQALKDDIGGH